MIQNAPLPSGGGNVEFSRTVKTPLIVRRTAAIGDALCASIVAQKLQQMGYHVRYQTHRDIHCVFRRHPEINDVSVPGGAPDVDLDGAYETMVDRQNRHFHDMFFEVAGRQLAKRGIALGNANNLTPRLVVAPEARERASRAFGDHLRPWVIISPRSNSYNVRQVADAVWVEVAPKINGTCFWMGTTPAPPGTVDLTARHLDNIIEWIGAADLVVSVDTGPLHIAAALRTPLVAIEQSSSPQLHLSDLIDYTSVQGTLDCLNCQKNICPKNQHLPPCQYLDASIIAKAVNDRLSQKGKVSCIISTFNAPVGRLNKCIASVINQVDEVIVTKEKNAIIPPGATTHPKVRYVSSRFSKLGYGKNMNFGARHSSGEFLWFLNDDCYPAADCREKMMEVMTDGVGMVGHLLRYPNGQICHAGKFRNPGMRGWGLFDNRQWHNTVKEPIQMENVTGTSVLVRREAFYGCGAFDEDFFLYAEDDAFALAMGQAGWKIMYTPHAMATHDEAATTSKFKEFLPWVQAGNATLERKWGWWLDKNKNTIPGIF
jgi:GT2 family glycosyltransferase